MCNRYYYDAIGGLVLTERGHFLSCRRHIYYSHLYSAGFQHFVCHESFLFSFLMLLTRLVKLSFVRWYQKCVTVTSCGPVHKLSWRHCRFVITGRAHIFYFWLIYIYAFNFLHTYMYISNNYTMKFCKLVALHIECIINQSSRQRQQKPSHN